MNAAKQFTTTRRFSISLSGTPVEIEAEIAFCAYSIMRATCPAGLPFDVSLDDLEIFESYVEEQITSTTTQALNLETGQMETFTVTAWGSDILAIQNGTYIDYGEKDEKEDYGSFPEPDQCNTCKAWCYEASDHQSNCPSFEENPLPF